MMSSNRFETVVDGLTFPEGPRWHDDALWFSDMHDGRVLRWRPGGEVETMVRLPEGECPSGLGFLPDGSVLVVAMHARQVLRLDGTGLQSHADLSGIATGNANDMLVDPSGRAYVGNFGDDSAPPEPVTPAVLAMVRPDGTVERAADDLCLPNGMGLLDDGRTLAVAETRALPPRITTYAVAADGTLSDRRLLVELDDEMPDGVSVAADNSIWFASPFTGEVIHLTREGSELERLSCPQPPYACVVGPAGMLYVCVADDWVPERCRDQRSGAVLAVDVGV